MKKIFVVSEREYEKTILHGFFENEDDANKLAERLKKESPSCADLIDVDDHPMNTRI